MSNIDTNILEVNMSYSKELSLPNSGLHIQLARHGIDYALTIAGRSSFYIASDLVKLFEFLGEAVIKDGLDKYLSFGPKGAENK
jgi:hypothetical protein